MSLREPDAWILRKARGEDHVFDRVVEALLFLTGDPVSVEIAD